MATRRVAVEGWVAPMLATLSDERDLGKGWVFERKFDGIRAIAFLSGDVRLYSRNRLSLSDSFGEVVEALRKQRLKDSILDGEVVAFKGARSSFELLQQRGAKDVRLVYVVFDAVRLAGRDITELPLVERKDLLRAALRPDPRVEVSVERKGTARGLLERACARGWEGLIAKRADAPYRPGTRTRDWLKLKCSLEQEFVVGGFSDPKGSRAGFGALLLGVYDGTVLRYAGEVGTGFSHELLRTLRARLDAIERDRSPFADFAKPRKGVHWVAPKLVAQVGFSEWTRDGRLRHPRFLGMRTDKRARDVVREVPA